MMEEENQNASLPPPKGEKKKKKKSKQPEGEGISAHSDDGEHRISSLRMDEQGKRKSPKKKAKKRSKEDHEHTSRRTKTEEANIAATRILGGNTDVKCQPQYVPWSNPKKESMTSHKHNHHHHKREHHPIDTSSVSVM